MNKVEKPSFFSEAIRYYIINTPLRFGRTLLMQLVSTLITNKRFVGEFGDKCIYDFDISQWIDRNLYFFGEYEKIGQDTVKKYLNNNSTFLDLGANSGIYTLAMSRVCKNVFAFEPDLVNRMRLEKNISLNRLNNIKVIPYAVSDREGEAKFYINIKNRGMNSLFKLNKTQRTIGVRTTTVDKIAEQFRLKNVDAIKMDIEGSEVKALTGMVETIKKFRPVVFIEISNEYARTGGSNISATVEFFLRHNYYPYLVEGQDTRKLSKKELANTDQRNVLFKPNNS